MNLVDQSTKTSEYKNSQTNKTKRHPPSHKVVSNGIYTFTRIIAATFYFSHSLSCIPSVQNITTYFYRYCIQINRPRVLKHLVRDTIRITLLAQGVAEDHITFNKRNVVPVHIQKLRLEDVCVSLHTIWITVINC